MKYHFFCIFTFGLIAAGCQNTSQDRMCSQSETINSVEQIISDQSINSIVKNPNFNKDSRFSKSSIRASLTKIDTNIDAIRTEKKDPDSEKVFCVARISYIIPAENLEKVSQAASEALNGTTIEQMANSYGFEQEANVFISEISYSALPTDDKKIIYTEISEGSSSLGFLSNLLIADILGNKATTPISIDQPKTENNNLQKQYNTIAAEINSPLTPTATAPKLTIPQQIFQPSLALVYAPIDDEDQKFENNIIDNSSLCINSNEINCLIEEYQKIDSELNKTYQILQSAHLEFDGNENEQLRRNQRQWISNRDLCDQYNTKENAIRCKITSAQQRTDILKKILNSAN